MPPTRLSTAASPAGDKTPVALPDLRLAAIDLDGTLLGPDLAISAANRQAVRDLHAAGIEVVLASGRHFESLQPFAQQLPEVRWVISAQGGEVGSVDRALILERNFLPGPALRAILAAGRQLGLAAMIYTPAAILTPAGAGEAVTFYSRLSGVSPIRVTDRALQESSAYKVVWVAAPGSVPHLRREPAVAALRLPTLQTHDRLLELMPAGVTKGSGLAVLERKLGFTARQTVAFGDAENDIPMFERAGASVAMPHGWPAALARARWIGPSGPPETALARAVAFVLPGPSAGTTGLRPGHP